MVGIDSRTVGKDLDAMFWTSSQTSPRQKRCVDREKVTTTEGGREGRGEGFWVTFDKKKEWAFYILRSPFLYRFDLAAGAWVAISGV
jgi:hypothetical protein